MTPLLHRFDEPKSSAPRLDAVRPPAAMPGGEVEVLGAGLAAVEGIVPRAQIGDTPAYLSLSRSGRAVVRVPEGAISGDLVLTAVPSARPIPSTGCTSAGCCAGWRRIAPRSNSPSCRGGATIGIW